MHRTEQSSDISQGQDASSSYLLAEQGRVPNGGDGGGSPDHPGVFFLVFISYIYIYIYFYIYKILQLISPVSPLVHASNQAELQGWTEELLGWNRH